MDECTRDARSAQDSGLEGAAGPPGRERRELAGFSDVEEDPIVGGGQGTEHVAENLTDEPVAGRATTIRSRLNPR